MIGTRRKRAEHWSCSQLVLCALQSPQEALHIRMPHMVLAEGTMMLFEARVAILGNHAAGETG